MWVRAQWNNVLCEVKRLGIAEDSYDNEWNVVSETKNDIITLGSYNSEEEAMRVLDLAEEFLNNKKKTVFRMPKAE